MKTNSENFQKYMKAKQFKLSPEEELEIASEANNNTLEQHDIRRFELNDRLQAFYAMMSKRTITGIGCDIYGELYLLPSRFKKVYPYQYVPTRDLSGGKKFLLGDPSEFKRIPYVYNKHGEPCIWYTIGLRGVLLPVKRVVMMLHGYNIHNRFVYYKKLYENGEFDNSIENLGICDSDFKPLNMKKLFKEAKNSEYKYHLSIRTRINRIRNIIEYNRDKFVHPNKLKYPITPTDKSIATKYYEEVPKSPNGLYWNPKGATLEKVKKLRKALGGYNPDDIILDE